MNVKGFALLVACLYWAVFYLPPSTASGQTVVNGGFETPVLGPNGWKEYSSGESFGGWTVSLQQVRHWRISPIPELVELDEAETNQVVALNGALFQDFSTAPGRDYLVSFTVMTYSGDDVSPSLRVSFGSASTLFRTEKPSSAVISLHFAASNAITRLEFRSFGYGVAVDDVTLTTVPRLSITPSNGGNHTLIAWNTHFADYTLEYSTALSETNWLPVTNSINQEAELALVAVDAATGPRFFRLRKP